MADEIDAVFVQDSQGKLRAMHSVCATWLQLEPVPSDRQPFHTEVCLGCGRFLDAAPPERTGTANVDGKSLL
jgi:hypothetical protein